MSEHPAKGLKPLHRRSLVIRRDDHIGDPVGLAFLEGPDGKHEEILRRLGDYLGDKVAILKAEVAHDRIEVEVESRGWREEAARLAAAARDLHKKGARRNAASLYREALDMDPMNAEALIGLGTALDEQGKHADAMGAFKKARELSGDSVDVLIAIGRNSMRAGRTTGAIAAFERALELEPRNFIARRSLRALGRAKPSSPPPTGRGIPSNRK